MPLYKPVPVWGAVPSSYLDLTLLVWHRGAVRKTAKSRAESSFFFVFIWGELPILQVWLCFFPFSMGVSIARALCGCCPPWQCQPGCAEPQEVAEEPGEAGLGVS